MKKLLALCLVLAMSVSLLAGCGSTPDASSGTDTTSGSDEAAGTDTASGSDAAGKEIIFNNTAEPPQMSSILTTSTGSMNVLRHIMDGLTMMDENDEPVAAMAESWELSDDSLTYTFHLREGQKWSNGETVTANDFIYAWDIFFTAETAAPYAGTWAPLILGANEKLNGEAPSADVTTQLETLGYENGVGYKAIDEYTIQITMTNPYPFFLSVLAFPNFLPVNPTAYEEFGDAYATEAENIITNGAWKMTEWVHEDRIVLEKNEEYWDAANVNIGKITMVAISDNTTAFNAFDAGEVNITALPSTMLQQALDNGWDVQYFDDGSCWYFEFNTLLPGLDNAKIRRALTVGVDAQAFVDTMVQNASPVANCLTPPAIQRGEFTAAVGALIERSDDYTAAKALLDEGLAEAGLTAEELNLTLTVDETETAGRYAAFFQEQWRTHLGLEVAIEQVTYKDRLTKMEQKDFSMVMAGWSQDYNDPMTFLDLFVSDGGNNHTSYANPEYDALIEQARTEADPAVRQDIMIECEKVLMRDLPIGPIYNRVQQYVITPGITGVVRSAATDVSFRFADITE